MLKTVIMRFPRIFSHQYYSFIWTYALSYEQNTLQTFLSNTIPIDTLLFPKHFMVQGQNLLFPVVQWSSPVICFMMWGDINSFSTEKNNEKSLDFVTSARWEELPAWVKTAHNLCKLAQTSRRAECRQEERSINTLITVSLLISIYASLPSTFMWSNENTLSK